ncbi:hypothetical protein [Deinococcus petrolearius]|uniref:Copper amine oxidase domain protein n=1 Tax=Deinococcus petrolearius TaxID=1751295 RepID=A0ABW1DID0_9DEIO
MRLSTLNSRLALGALLCVSTGLAQTAPAPSSPVPAAPAQAVPARRASGATSRVASAVAVTVSKAVAGQIVGCPAGLKVSPQAVCLYSKQAAASVRPAVRGALGALVLGDWKTSGPASSLLVRASAGGPLGAYVLLSPVTAQETLLVVDAAAPSAAASARPAAPAGVVKGQPYLLGRDLTGVVNVVSLGAGKFRLNVAGETALTVTAGQKTAQRAGGNVELPLPPVSDGKNLIFPVAGLRALGCTVSDNAGGLTIACGPDSVGVKPIVF